MTPDDAVLLTRLAAFAGTTLPRGDVLRLLILAGDHDTALYASLVADPRDPVRVIPTGIAELVRDARAADRT